MRMHRRTPCRSPTSPAAFDAVALGDDRVEVLAGAASDGFVTYVQRSALFAFPDYVSVRFIEADGGGSTLAVSHARATGRATWA